MGVLKMSDSHKKLEINHGHYALRIRLDPRLGRAQRSWDEGSIEIQDVAGNSHFIGLSKEDLSELANFLKPYGDIDV
jgi:hypothetical protein